MESLTQQLTRLVGDVFASHAFNRQFGEVLVSGRPDLGQFQCNGALPAAKQSDRSPRQIAQEIADVLAPMPLFQTVTVAGPGFINLSLTPDYLASHIQEMAISERLGCTATSLPIKIIVDYGGPNVAKPLHVGHLRAAIIGESLKRVARFLGHHVIGDVHLGDWGLQMGMLISEMERRQPDLPHFDGDYTGPYPDSSPVTIADLEEMYPQASQRAQNAPEAMEAARQATYELQQGRPGYQALWRHFVDVSVADLKSDYDRLNIQFDLWLGESDTQDRIPGLIERLLAQGHAYESQGATVVDVSGAEDEDNLPPLMLVKSDGAVLYGTTDLATIDQRVQDLQAQQILYVVDNRQSDHFRQVFRAAYRTGVAPTSVRLEHAGFGTMNGADGKPFKTRVGGVMKLKDLIEMVTQKALERMHEAKIAVDYPTEEKVEVARMVGVAMLKYGDLMNHRTKNYVFDLDRFSTFEGKTGPYLLFTAVRCKSILRKAQEQNLHPGEFRPSASEIEQALMLKIDELQDRLASTYTERAPNHLCDYVYTLAVAFNRFYERHHILREADSAQQASWLALVKLTGDVFEQTLDLLGIEIPERM
ncbi:arginine--tRNA ligase [bacterium]|nr:arginine--tRNA ligase [bacterium]